MNVVKKNHPIWKKKIFFHKYYYNIIAYSRGSTSISLNIVYSFFYIDPTVGVMHNAILYTQKRLLGSVIVNSKYPNKYHYNKNS